MSKIHIYGDSAPLHIEITAAEDPRILKLKKIIDRLDEAVAYHTGKHTASPKVEGPSGWVDMLDVLDDLTEALNENRG